MRARMGGLDRSSATVVAVVTLLGAAACGRAGSASPRPVATSSAPLLAAFPGIAHVVATGIPGASAITQVGAFHPGGPIHDKPAFSPATQPGAILDPDRVLVASSSNFGAPLAPGGGAAGAILSIDPAAGATTPIAVPATFASAGGQASTPDGSVMLFTAQSPAFLNGLDNPAAVTAALPSVGLPLGISINDAFGRLWFANAPNGSGADGTITVIDPSGIPLAGAPSAVAGGVFSGHLTDRAGVITNGLSAGAIATALVTKSPDGSNRAVFFAALADGSVEQVHVAKGVSDFAPAGSFTPIPGISPAAVESADPGTVTRVGIAFNWVPARILYVTDPLANRLVAFDFSDDGSVFLASAPRFLTSAAFDVPVDVAASSPEVASGNFSSGTTLAGGSDLYVLNRGNGTVVRIRQDGTVVAARAIVPDQPLPPLTASGLAVSPDGQTLWIAATGPNRQGYVLRMASFGAGPITASMLFAASLAGAQGVIADGADMFSRDLSPLQLVGPLFNAQSCVDCHGTPAPGGMAATPTSEVRIGTVQNGAFQLVDGGLARSHSIAEFGFPCPLPTGVPPDATVTAPRLAMTLRGTALIDDIQQADILKNRAAEPAAVQGTANVLPDGRIGRFGWKAQLPTLVEFMGDAFRSEMGITNPLAPSDFVTGCGAALLVPEIDAVPVEAVTAFATTLDPPAPSATCLGSPGATTFQTIGCASCHTPSLPSRGSPPTRAFLYSDLLLHDMGPGLADGFQLGSATGSQFRTMPLWRVSDRIHFLHDGRASTIPDAIRAHGGQAAAAAGAFQQLQDPDLQALLGFLGCI